MNMGLDAALSSQVLCNRVQFPPKFGVENLVTELLASYITDFSNFRSRTILLRIIKDFILICLLTYFFVQQVYSQCTVFAYSLIFFLHFCRSNNGTPTLAVALIGGHTSGDGALTLNFGAH